MKGYELIKREEIFDGKIINVVKDTINLPNGETTDRELVLHHGAAAIVPLFDNGDIMLVEQYRHSTGGLTLEIPAGCLDNDEEPLTCAIRELREETGLCTEDFEYLFTLYSAIGFSNEKISIYLAKNFTAGEQDLDDDEFVNLKRVHLDDAIKMIYTGEINDGKSIAAIMAVKQKITNK